MPVRRGHHEIHVASNFQSLERLLAGRPRRELLARHPGAKRRRSGARLHGGTGGFRNLVQDRIAHAQRRSDAGRQYRLRRPSELRFLRLVGTHVPVGDVAPAAELLRRRRADIRLADLLRRLAGGRQQPALPDPTRGLVGDAPKPANAHRPNGPSRFSADTQQVGAVVRSGADPTRSRQAAHDPKPFGPPDRNPEHDDREGKAASVRPFRGADRIHAPASARAHPPRHPARAEVHFGRNLGLHRQRGFSAGRTGRGRRRRRRRAEQLARLLHGRGERRLRLSRFGPAREFHNGHFALSHEWLRAAVDSILSALQGRAAEISRTERPWRSS